MDFGKLAYDSYCKHTGGKTYDGRDCPAWETLPDRIREAWRYAASTVAAVEAYGNYADMAHAMLKK